MKRNVLKSFGIGLMLLILTSCSDDKDDITNEINKAGSIESSVTVEHLSNNITNLLTLFEDLSIINQRYLNGTNFTMEKNKLYFYILQIKDKMDNIVISNEVYDIIEVNSKNYE